MNLSMHSFWTKGGENYAKALRTQYETERDALKAKIRQCQNYVEKAALTEELETLKKDFQNKLRQTGRSLF
jgi:hypothetical protein